MWWLGEIKLKCKFLANILSFVIQNLTQHVHCTSWYFRNEPTNHLLIVMVLLDVFSVSWVSHSSFSVFHSPQAGPKRWNSEILARSPRSSPKSLELLRTDPRFVTSEAIDPARWASLPMCRTISEMTFSVVILWTTRWGWSWHRCVMISWWVMVVSPFGCGIEKAPWPSGQGAVERDRVYGCLGWWGW